MRSFLISVLALLLSACVSTAGYQQRINQWQGKNIYTLMHKWGQPDAAIQLANGHKIYKYTRKTKFSIPDPNRTPLPINGGSFSSYAEPWDSNLTITRYCQTFFETTADDRITHISFKGNNCVAPRIS